MVEAVGNRACEDAVLDHGAEMALGEIRGLHGQQEPEALGRRGAAFSHDPPDGKAQRFLARSLAERADMDPEAFRQFLEGCGARPRGRAGGWL